MLTLTVEEKVYQKGHREPKTRSFSVSGIGYILADSLWDGGSTGSDMRPVLLSIVGKETTLRPFVANLRKGRAAIVDGQERRGWSASERKLKILKKAGHISFKQKIGDLTAVTFYVPELFKAEPGMVDPLSCDVISAPPLWWVNDQARKIGSDGAMLDTLRTHLDKLGLFDASRESRVKVPQGTTIDVDDIPQLAALSAHYMAMVDKRVKHPLVDDLTFAVQLYLAALAQGVASTMVKDRYDARAWNKHQWAAGFWVEGSEDMGLAMAVATHASQETMAQFLMEQVKLWSEVKHG